MIIFSLAKNFDTVVFNKNDCDAIKMYKLIRASIKEHSSIYIDKDNKRVGIMWAIEDAKHLHMDINNHMYDLSIADMSGAHLDFLYNGLENLVNKVVC